MDIKTVIPSGANTADLTPRAEAAVRVAKEVAARALRPASDENNEAVQKLNDLLVRSAAPELGAAMNAKLELDIDPETERVIGRIVDKHTGQVIKQIPAADVLKLIAMTEKAIGSIVDQSL